MEDFTFRQYLKESGYDKMSYQEEVYTTCLGLGNYQNIDLYYQDEIDEAYEQNVPVNELAARLCAQFDTDYGKPKPEEIEINTDDVLEKGKTYKITGCGAGGKRIQLYHIGFKDCVAIFGKGGTYWYNNDNDCGGEIMVTYPVTVTIPTTADVTIGGCGY